jgi:hypothetical protein
MINFRSLFAALVIAAACSQACAWPVHGIVPPPSGGFNGGKSQIQSQQPVFSGDFPFIDLLRDQANSWQGTDTTNNNSAIDPSWLDANGYPLASALSGTGAVSLHVAAVPGGSSRPATAANPFVVTWQGTGPITVRIVNYPLTFLTCANCTGNSQPSVLDPSSGLYKGRIEFYPTTYNNNGSPPSFYVQVLSMGVGAAFTMNAGQAGIEMHFLDDETNSPGYLTGTEIVSAKYKQVLQQSGAGIFRAMDWLNTNATDASTWATRKTYTYPTWTDDEYRASLYPGDIMTNSGNNYSLTSGSFALADKLTMHVHLSADDTFQGNQTSGMGFASVQCCMTLSGGSGSALTFNWTGQPYSNGQPVGFLYSGNSPTGIFSGATYYVVNATANSFQISTSLGGSALAPASNGSGVVLIAGFDTLSLNGSAAYPIKSLGAEIITPSGGNTSALHGFNGSVKIYGTVVFDQALQAWLIDGAQPFSGGLSNVVPPEAFLQICKELGMYPHISVPYLALDPMTDYVPSLAAYIKNNEPSWMVPHFEPGNEVWNGSTPITQYAYAKSWAHWDAPTGPTTDWPNWMGMVASTVGQAVANVYGKSGLGTAYHIRVGVQTDGFGNPISNPNNTLDPAFTAADYVASGPVQSGYVQDPAYNWVDAVQVSNYVSPAMRGTIAEWENSWDWFFTSASNPTQQMADLNAYVDTLCGVGCSTNIGYTVPYESARWTNAHTWAQRFGVQKMFAYEGGYSPDLMPTFYDLQGPTQSAMQSNPGASEAVPVSSGSNTVIDIRQVITADRGVSQSQQTGNPAQPGMLIYLSAVNGMTELNCGNGFPVFTSGSADVTWTTHNLNVNQRVQFGGNNLPSNVTAGQAYYVISTNLTTNTFEFSATRGGSAIVPNASASSNVTVFSAFTVISTAAGSGMGFNNLTTIDANSTTYPAATSVPFVNFPNSLTIINNFRTATLLQATDMQAQMLASYNTFVADGGTFPAQYEISGTGSIWPPIQPDIWGTQGGELAAITQFNAH